MTSTDLRRVLAGSTVSALALGRWAGVAIACPLCAASKGDSPTSYSSATAVLTIVPIAIFGSIALWLRRNARRMAEHDARAGAAPGSRPTDTSTPEI